MANEMLSTKVRMAMAAESFTSFHMICIGGRRTMGNMAAGILEST